MIAEITLVAHELFNWAVAHPEVAIAVVGAVGSGLTAIFKARTPEEYAAMSPRKAALLKLGSALLPDMLKTVDATKQLVSGKSDAEMRLPVEKQ